MKNRHTEGMADRHGASGSGVVGWRRRVIKGLTVLGFIVVGSCGLPGAALGHFGQGNATPSNGGDNPKASHPSWSDDYCTRSLNGIPGGSFDFRHACVHHDGCYKGFPDRNGKAVYWAGKAQCDDWFYDDLKATCGEQHPGVLQVVERRKCLNLAWVYYKAVQRFGNYHAPEAWGIPVPPPYQPVAPIPQPNLPAPQPLAPIPTHPSAPPQTPASEAPTWLEQQGSLGANSFLNPYNASGMGAKIAPYQWVDVACKVYAPQIVSANPDGYWYRITSPPWNGAYYAVANTFWNGDVPGQKPYTHNTDLSVANC